MQVICDIVTGLSETYNTLNPFELCECLNIKILYSNLGDEIKGFFQRTPDGCEIIHINSEIDETEKNYLCTHELGHAILHPDISLSLFIENKLQVKNKYEIEADKFAAELLISIDADNPCYKDMSISQLSAVLCVPERLIRYKFGI